MRHSSLRRWRRSFQEESPRGNNTTDAIGMLARAVEPRFPPLINHEKRAPFHQALQKKHHCMPIPASEIREDLGCCVRNVALPVDCWQLSVEKLRKLSRSLLSKKNLRTVFGRHKRLIWHVRRIRLKFRFPYMLRTPEFQHRFWIRVYLDNSGSSGL